MYICILVSVGAGIYYWGNDLYIINLFIYKLSSPITFLPLRLIVCVTDMFTFLGVFPPAEMTHSLQNWNIVEGSLLTVPVLVTGVLIQTRRRYSN